MSIFFLLRLKTFHIDLKILLCYSLIMGDEKMTVNERIKIIRTENNLTLEKFGERIGVTKSTISNIENGNRNATEHMIKSICREFNVNYDWLKDGKGEMFDAVPETLVDELAQEFQLDDLDKRIILGYLRLSEADRGAIKRYVQNILENK